MNPEEPITPTTIVTPKPKKRLIMVIVALVVVIALAVVAVYLHGRQAMVKRAEAPSQTAKESSITKAHLYFNPSSVLLTATDQSKTATIMISTPNDTSAVELHMLYDPQALQNVSIFAPETTIFGDHTKFYIVKNTVDTAKGTIQFTIGALPGNKKLASGTGVVAVIAFTRNLGYTRTSSGLAFLNTTIVTQKGSKASVLNKADPLNIDFLR